MQRAPALSGFQRPRWWLAGLRQAVPWLTQRSLPCVWQTLRRFRLVYKRGRQSVHSPDPDYDLKLAYLRAAEHLARTDPQRYVLVYQDEFTYYRRPSLARAYAPQGSKQPVALSSYGTNRTRRICASLNWLTGALTTQQRSRLPRQALVQHYRSLEALYPQAEVIFVAQDNWPVHFHPDLLLALVGSRILLLRLPTYAPWTNPVEKVWLRLNQEVLHLHRHSDQWPQLQVTVQQWLDQWRDGSPELLRAVGLSPY